MGAWWSNSKEEMSHSDLAAGEKTNRIHLSERTEELVANTWYSLSRKHIQELFTYKEVGREIWAPDTRGGKGAAGEDRPQEASK